MCATEKQKKAFKEVVKGSNISQAMKKAKYADSTSKRTNKLTRSKGWEELKEEYLPDKDLAKVHKEGLKATTKKPHLIDRDDKGRPIYDYVKENDFQTRHKYLDTAYKIKGRHAPDKLDVVVEKKPILDKEVDDYIKWREQKDAGSKNN